ncbi:MAG: FAD:protein FMN transferase [Candidatus Symbiothrix sp.]|jgi:thiamine biosynthesis lipoprotein|nr:FAD:protein FMN transferase [Candidatus Symbiothrix sp.]
MKKMKEMKEMKKIKRMEMTKTFLSFLSFLSFFSFFSCGTQEKYFLTQGEIFKTTTHIKYQYHRDLGKELFARLDSFDLSLNPFNSYSIIYKVNHNEAVEVDDWFIAVFNRAKEISEMTGGVYDITCAPLVNLWGFGFEKSDEVTPYLIDSLKQFVGYQKVRLEGRKVIKADPRLQLNASSIAKGYACDVLAELLESYGITDYMVEIGGEIHAKGKNPEGEYWQIEILKPIDDATGTKQESYEVVQLADYSLATSGNYRNFYIKDGKKYAHTINPLTGYPVEGNILSASVMYPDCMTADACATAFMALGLEKACALAEQFPGMDYLFIYAEENGNLLEKRRK